MNLIEINDSSKCHVSRGQPYSLLKIKNALKECKYSQTQVG